MWMAQYHVTVPFKSSQKVAVCLTRSGWEFSLTDSEGLSDLVCTGLFEHLGVGMSVKGSLFVNVTHTIC